MEGFRVGGFGIFGGSGLEVWGLGFWGSRVGDLEFRVQGVRAC